LYRKSPTRYEWHQQTHKLRHHCKSPPQSSNTMPLKDLPPDARPREKLLARGAGALSDVELLALLLRTGIKGKGRAANGA
jgi:hypothetical protein